MASISNIDSKSQLLQATDIVSLIGQTVSLKKRGKDFIGLCPFHQEKTPSFHVNPSKQLFYCYGCKAGGSAIDFVMRRDRIEFKEALTVLADAVGFQLPRSDASNHKKGERQLLLDAHSAACSFYEKLLAHPQRGAAARAYLEKRRFSPDTLRRFQIGFAPEGWDDLLNSDVGRKFTPDILSRAGLLKPRQNGAGFYDTFRNRVMFPIRDEQGRIIAFGGRAMPDSQDPAKYLNSPETPLFSKSRCLYGLDLAKQRCVETRTVILTEGYADTAMAHQFGVTNVVSALGTALTEQHVTTLRRFVDRIVLLFDPDTAGEQAVNRALELFLTQPVELLIASMPDNADPDEFLLAHGADALNQLVEQATDALSYKWKLMHRDYQQAGDDLTGRQKIVENYLSTLASARGSGPVDPIRWGAVLARVSKLTDIPADTLNRRFRASVSTPRRAFAPSAPAPVQPPTATLRIAPEQWTARDRAERWILGVLLNQPHHWQTVQTQILVDDFADEQRKKLAELYWQHQRDEGLPVLNEFLLELGDPALMELAVELVEEVDDLPQLDHLLDDAVRHLADEQRRLENARATSRPRQSAQDEIELLKRLQDNARQPDLRRA